MKVCMVAFAHNDLDGRIIRREAQILRKVGHEVTVIIRSRTNRPLQVLERDGIRLLLLARRPASMFMRMVTDPFMFVWLALVMMVKARDSDVFHCHEYQSLVLGWFVARLARRLVIYDCHEFQPETFGHQLAELWPRLYEPGRRIFARFERVMNRHVDAAVVAHEGLIERFKKDCDKVVYFPNYPFASVIEDRSMEPPRELQEKLRGKTVLLFAGAIDPWRGIESNFKVLSELKKLNPNVHMVLAGFCDERYQAALMDLAGTLGIQGDITFMGRFVETEVGRVLHLGHIGIILLDAALPWHQGSEGTKFFQYAGAGLPIVVTDVPVYRRLVEEVGNGILVDPRDPSEVARRVADLIADGPKRQDMSQKGIVAFRSRWTAESVAPRMVDLYEGLLRR